jgi:hypothetical protein
MMRRNLGRKLPTPAHLQGAVDLFNLDFPVGTRVILRTDSGEVETVVRGKAVVLGRHSAVAWFKGIAGCYDIQGRVTIAKGGAA